MTSTITPKPNAGLEPVAPTASGPAFSGASDSLFPSATAGLSPRQPRSQRHERGRRPRRRFRRLLSGVLLPALATVGLYALLVPAGTGLLDRLASRSAWNAFASNASPRPEPLPAPPRDPAMGGDDTGEDPVRVAPAPIRVVPPRPRDGAAAPPPTVQVLNGSGDPAKLAAAVQALRTFGYRVVVTETLPDTYVSSAVLVTPGFEDQAAELVAADPRFGAVREAPRFVTPADLHVILGTNWPQ